VTSFKLPSFKGEEILADAEKYPQSVGRPIGNDRAKYFNKAKCLQINNLFNL
jgi:hypothetical protein